MALIHFFHNAKVGNRGKVCHGELFFTCYWITRFCIWKKANRSAESIYCIGEDRPDWVFEGDYEELLVIKNNCWLGYLPLYNLMVALWTGIGRNNIWSARINLTPAKGLSATVFVPVWQQKVAVAFWLPVVLRVASAWPCRWFERGYYQVKWWYFHAVP